MVLQLEKGINVNNVQNALFITLFTFGFWIMPKDLAAETNDFIKSEIISRSFEKPISQIAWNNIGDKIAVNSHGEISLWALAANDQIWSKRMLSIAQFGLAFSPDDKLVVVPSLSTATANPGTVRHTALTLIPISAPDDFKYLEDENVADSPKSPIPNFAITNDGSALVSILGQRTGWLTVYDPSSWKTVGHVGQLKDERGNLFFAQNIAVDGKNKLVAIASPNGEVQIWDYHANKKISNFHASKTGIKSIAFNPVSGELFTGGDGKIIGAVLQSDGHLGPGGLQDESGSLLRAWNPVSGELIKYFPGTHYGISSISVSPNGLYVAATEGGSLSGVRLFVWRISDGTLLQSINYGQQDGNLPVSFGPNGQRLAVGVGKEVHLYDLN